MELTDEMVAMAESARAASDDLLGSGSGRLPRPPQPSPFILRLNKGLNHEGVYKIGRNV